MFGDDWRIEFYFFAQLLGSIGITFLLTSMLWPTNCKRNPVLISLCVSWWISTFPCLLILYYAGYASSPQPPYPTCLASATLTMAQAPMVAFSAPALVIHLWYLTRKAVFSTCEADTTLNRRTRLVTIGLAVLPFIVFLLAALATLIVGVNKPSLVHRALFYCIIDYDPLSSTLSVIGALALVSSLIFGTWAFLLLWNNRSRVTDRGLDIPFIIRVMIFGVYICFGLVLNVMAIFNWTSPIPDLFVSTFSLAIFIIFGSHRETWRPWIQALSILSRAIWRRLRIVILPPSRLQSPILPAISINVNVETSTCSSMDLKTPPAIYVPFSSKEAHGLYYVIGSLSSLPTSVSWEDVKK